MPTSPQRQSGGPAATFPVENKMIENIHAKNDKTKTISEESGAAILKHYKTGRKLAIELRSRNADLSNSSVSYKGGNYIFDDTNDLKFRNEESLPSHSVLTMFTQQWVGIRQACSSLSGHKLGINGHHVFDSIEIGEIAHLLRAMNIDQVVYHGMANSTAGLVRGLKKLLPDVRFYGVWHGTMAGWSSSEELKLFNQFLQLADDKIYERLGFLRQGMQKIHKKSYGKMLYNIPPKLNVSRMQSPFETLPIKCIFASWNNSWKNMYTNILAANCSNVVGDIFLYYKPELEIFDKVRLVEFGGHEMHYQRLATMDLCLNVSINDCQPMTELEALSVGTPSLRNDWNLDLESQNSYEDVFTVRSYLNADAITKKIEQLSALDPIFIRDITEQHRRDIIRASKIRYYEFLS